MFCTQSPRFNLYIMIMYREIRMNKGMHHNIDTSPYAIIQDSEVVTPRCPKGPNYYPP